MDVALMKTNEYCNFQMGVGAGVGLHIFFLQNVSFIAPKHWYKKYHLS